MVLSCGLGTELIQFRRLPPRGIFNGKKEEINTVSIFKSLKKGVSTPSSPGMVNFLFQYSVHIWI